MKSIESGATYPVGRWLQPPYNVAFRGSGRFERLMANSAHDRRQRGRADNAPPGSSSAGEVHDAGDDFPVLVFVQERLREIVAEKEVLEERLGRGLGGNEEVHQGL